MTEIEEIHAVMYKTLTDGYQDFLITESYPDFPAFRFAFLLSAVQEIEKDTTLEPVVRDTFLDRLRADMAMLALDIPNDIIQHIRK